MSWTERNLAVQGYRLTTDQARARWGLRFPTALCLGLVVAGLVLQSAILILALVPVGVFAGWTRRHPFDLIWNHGLRYVSGAPELPPNPAPRRHGFKVGAVWLLAVGLLLAVDQTTAALILGVMLVGACGLLTAANFCLPSTLLSLWDRRRSGIAPTGAAEA